MFNMLGFPFHTLIYSDTYVMAVLYMLAKDGNTSSGSDSSDVAKEENIGSKQKAAVKKK